MKPGKLKREKESSKFKTFGKYQDLKPDVRKKYKKLKKSIDMDPKTNEDFKSKMRKKLDQTILSHEKNFLLETDQS